MNEWFYLLIVLGVCALMCAVGFFKFLYFISLGYGLAIFGGSIAIFVISLVNNLSSDLLWLNIIQMVCYIIYGLRLSIFLLIREIKSAAYIKSLKEDERTMKRRNFLLSLIIWITCSILYLAQVSPFLFRVENSSGDIILPIIGISISILGLIIESVADYQKSAQKKINPNVVATKGLYKIVRCPNYLGEIIFWTGSFISGISSYSNHIEYWLISIFGYISIVYIMFNSTKRLEKKQNERYAQDETYQKYSSSTPILIPLIPLYHLNKKKKEN